ncbi:MAG: putative sugar nucleotidyl transferase [Chitinophagaceae bacterium]
MKFIDGQGVREMLFPFAEIRPVEEIRVGILSIKEKWQLILPCGYDVAIPSNLLPNHRHRQEIITSGHFTRAADDVYLERPWQIFQANATEIMHDFDLLTQHRVSQPLPASNRVLGQGHIFIEPGAIVECATINASAGPVYIGKNAEIMEGCLIRGPLALCEGAVLKMGAKVYGATTIGPYGVAGGEIKNSVIFGYSNKGHDGYLGDSVIGEWCNLGAGVSNSNLKNNAGEVRVYDHSTGQKISAGIKCGLLLGDYSRAAINTTFNTGTITGICCNIFGAGLTPGYIPSFSWGAFAHERYDFDKAIRDIRNWKQLKKQLLTDIEISRLRHIFDNQ